MGPIIKDLILIVAVIVAGMMAFSSFTGNHEVPSPPSIEVK